MKNKTGVLLVNLGTPNSPKPADVFRYLNEFLTDERVIDLPWLKRQCLVRGVIVPTRYRQSAQLYQKIWTDKGSPLLIHGEAVQTKLQEALGDDYHVALAMRYQNPSIPSVLSALEKARLDELIILPLFPQYASATTGSVHQKVMESIKEWNVIPKLTFIDSFYDHPEFISALCERAANYELQSYDHILFSFHGLPERQIRKADSRGECLTENCCQRECGSNRNCYKGQCYGTARAMARQLGLRDDSYTICFQSRLGKEPWLEPYTQEVIREYAAKGLQRMLVFCPAFVCDCLETTCEIAYEYAHEFKTLGGKELQLVEGLNDHPAWIAALKQMILEQ